MPLSSLPYGRGSFLPRGILRARREMSSEDAMPWFQHTLKLRPRSRGFHLITEQVVTAIEELREFDIALLHVFIRHTSASLTINENADRDVRHDMESSFSRLAPEDAPYRHTSEGPDDMPAHVKCSLLGASLSIPIADGQLCLGVWQGIYLCEHRDHAGGRELVLTLHGTRSRERRPG